MVDVQVLKQFVAFGQELKPGEVFDASNVNISRLNKLIAQRFVIPIKIQEGEIKPVHLSPDPKPSVEGFIKREDPKPEPEERKSFERVETAKKKWANPEFRSVKQNAMKKKWEDPVFRAKQKATRDANKAARKAAKEANKFST
jgi:hypothetical protein